MTWRLSLKTFLSQNNRKRTDAFVCLGLGRKAPHRAYELPYSIIPQVSNFIKIPHKDMFKNRWNLFVSVVLALTTMSNVIVCAVPEQLTSARSFADVKDPLLLTSQNEEAGQLILLSQNNPQAEQKFESRKPGALPLSLQNLDKFVAESIEHRAQQRFDKLPANSKPEYDEFLHKESLASQYCADMPDCLSCYNLSSWCHFCDDGQCHSQASPYGCLSGTTCYKNTDCVREKVEHVGVSPPSAGLVTGVLVLIMSTFACFACSITLCNAFARSHDKSINEPDPSYLELNVSLITCVYLTQI